MNSLNFRKRKKLPDCDFMQIVTQINFKNVENTTGRKKFESEPIIMQRNYSIFSTTLHFLSGKYKHYSFL